MRAGVRSRGYDRDPHFAGRSTQQSGRTNPTTKDRLGPGISLGPTCKMSVCTRAGL